MHRQLFFLNFPIVYDWFKANQIPKFGQILSLPLLIHIFFQHITCLWTLMTVFWRSVQTSKPIQRRRRSNEREGVKRLIISPGSYFDSALMLGNIYYRFGATDAAGRINNFERRFHCAPFWCHTIFVSLRALRFVCARLWEQRRRRHKQKSFRKEVTPLHTPRLALSLWHPLLLCCLTLSHYLAHHRYWTQHTPTVCTENAII